MNRMESEKPSIGKRVKKFILKIVLGLIVFGPHPVGMLMDLF